MIARVERWPIGPGYDWARLFGGAEMGSAGYLGLKGGYPYGEPG